MQENRFKILRNNLGLTQQEFADRLCIKRGAVANYEIGRNVPSDSVIALICREFNVSEAWLRYGEGEMLVPLTRDQEIADFMGEVLTDPDASPRKALICAVKKLGPEEWATLAKVAREWVEGMEKSSEN